ncbi:MAG TPA: FAD:protein FMN transferase, partial [Arthrobacter sp.]|nr:FAD:protein FMN transferase [Arthrobacter sp.]
GSDTPWRAGIVDPADRRTLLAGFPLGGNPLGEKTADGGTRVALATSGSAERGDHIWSATARAAEFLQVSVAAADVVTADVLATAIVAGGIPMLNRATAMWDIEALAVRTNGDLLATQGFRAG